MCVWLKGSCIYVEFYLFVFCLLLWSTLSLPVYEMCCTNKTDLTIDWSDEMIDLMWTTAEVENVTRDPQERRGLTLLLERQKLWLSSDVCYEEQSRNPGVNIWKQDSGV